MSDARSGDEPSGADSPPRPGAAIDTTPLPRHRHQLSRDTVRHSQITRVLIAVAEVVGEVGYARASIRQVASKAGISTKTFYELFPDKEAAFLASYASVDVLVRRMRTAVADAVDARGVVHAGLTEYLEALAAGPGFARALVLEALATTDAVRARRRRGLEQFAEIFAVGLRRVRGPESRDILARDTDRELTIAALGGVNELCVQHLSRFDAATLTDVAPVAQTLLELVILTPDERRGETDSPRPVV